MPVMFGCGLPDLGIEYLWYGVTPSLKTAIKIAKQKWSCKSGSPWSGVCVCVCVCVCVVIAC